MKEQAHTQGTNSSPMEFTQRVHNSRRRSVQCVRTVLKLVADAAGANQSACVLGESTSYPSAKKKKKRKKREQAVDKLRGKRTTRQKRIPDYMGNTWN